MKYKFQNISELGAFGKRQAYKKVEDKESERQIEYVKKKTTNYNVLVVE